MVTFNQGRALRTLALAATAAVLAVQIPDVVAVAGTPSVNGYAGIDYELYMNATRSWIDTGDFYEPHQLAGPYQIHDGDILYPPTALWLFVPSTFLPAVLWWIVPLLLTAWSIWRLRPGPLAWPLMALCLWGPVQIHIISGNPGIWAMAAVALGTVYRWPSVFALVKPSLGPFALFGMRDRRWWLTLAALVVLSAPLLPMWFDWVRVVANSRGGGLLYSWQEAPMMLLPILAWFARPGGRYDIERR